MLVATAMVLLVSLAQDREWVAELFETCVGLGFAVGPLLGGEVAAVAEIARPAGVPVLSLTNNASSAAPGAHVLGMLPQNQVERLVDDVGLALVGLVDEVRDLDARRARAVHRNFVECLQHRLLQAIAEALQLCDRSVLE